MSGKAVNRKTVNSRIKTALAAYEAAQMEYLLRDFDESAPVVFSDGFERRIRSLSETAKQQEKRYVHFGHRMYYKPVFLLVLLLILLAGIVTACGVYHAVRMHLNRFEEGSEVLYEISEAQLEQQPKALDIIFEPSRIPDGYEATEREKSKLFYNVTYENEQSNMLFFLQTKIKKQGKFINTEGIEVKNLEIKGCEAIYYVNEGICNLLWTDGMYDYSINGEAASLTEEDLTAMAESLVSENK